MTKEFKRLLYLIPVFAMLLVSACVTVTEPVAEPTEEPEKNYNASLEVHFIDVGQADSALLISNGEAMLIDGGNAEDSSLLYSYLKDCEIDHLEYVIGTHAHEDHMGGLTAALNKASVGKIYIPKRGNDTKFYNNFIKKAEEDKIEIAHPEKNEEFSLGTCSVNLFTPTYIDYEELNNTSIMTKVTCGDVSFLFTGDAERAEEENIINQGADLSATVLKAGHHGSDSSSSYPFLREVMPEVIVISVGKDNPYSHPHEEVLSRYHDLGAKIYRTDENGHIIIKTDGKNLSVMPVKQDNGEQEEIKNYIGNKSSKKLHLPTCANLPKEKNRVYFKTREEAVSVGYSPCQGCDP